MEKAAVLVHGRTRYRDYREKFLVRPVDMEGEQIYRWKSLVLRCTRKPERMRESHRLRRAVIAREDFIVIGVAGYFRDVYPAAFTDEGGRPVYGFLGFLWKREDAGLIQGFPGQQAFWELMEQYVLPRWEEAKNSVGAEQATFSDYLRRPGGWDEEQPVGEEARGLAWALNRARQGEDVFFCTGLSAEESEEQLTDKERNAFGAETEREAEQKPQALKVPALSGEAAGFWKTVKWLVAGAAAVIMGILAFFGGKI